MLLCNKEIVWSHHGYIMSDTCGLQKDHKKLIHEGDYRKVRWYEKEGRKYCGYSVENRAFACGNDIPCKQHFPKRY